MLLYQIQNNYYICDHYGLTHKSQLYFLHVDDSVYLPSEELLHEYILNENGILYQGSWDDITTVPWNFGQVIYKCIHTCSPNKIQIYIVPMCLVSLVVSALSEKVPWPEMTDTQSGFMGDVAWWWNSDEAECEL